MTSGHLRPPTIVRAPRNASARLTRLHARYSVSQQWTGDGTVRVRVAAQLEQQPVGLRTQPRHVPRAIAGNPEKMRMADLQKDARGLRAAESASDFLLLLANETEIA